MPKKEYKRGLQLAVIQIKKFLDAHPGTSVGVIALSIQHGVSRNAMQELFKEKYKRPIGEYKLKVRMDTARKLLKTGMSIKEVSYALRYSSASSFSNAFKSYHGTTAAEHVMELRRKAARRRKPSMGNPGE